jgi:hypothetical protein
LGGVESVRGYRQDWKLASIFTWAFFLEGTIDTLNAGPNFALHITNQNLVGVMGWLILTIYVPALVVSETVLGFYLVRRLFPKSDSQSSEFQ